MSRVAEDRRPRRFGPAVLHDVERELSEPLFHGVPLGPTLNDAVVIDLINGQCQWGWKDRGLDRIRRLRYAMCPPRAAARDVQLPQRRVLVAWMSASFRFSDLWAPVVIELGPEQCLVLGGNRGVLPMVPAGTSSVCWQDAVSCDLAAWRAEFGRGWPEWKTRLERVCRQHGLPKGACQRLGLHLLLNSRSVLGCFDLLRRSKPAAVLTDYDRNAQWSCLVLAARAMQIPTFTLVHGVLNEDAMGYVPVLADKIFCWGELSRQQLLAAGESAEKIVVGGCPRLTRDLPVTLAQGREALGLPADRPVALLGTAPLGVRHCLALAEMFCEAVGRLPGVSGVVRLHPSETLDAYQPVVRRWPAIRFCANGDATLEQSLAAADVVVVDLPELAANHSEVLVRVAGCPHVRTAEELAEAIRRLTTDEAERCRRHASAEQYVAQFCRAFGRDAARRIATAVRDAVPTEVARSNVGDCVGDGKRGGATALRPAQVPGLNEANDEMPSHSPPDVSVVIVSWNVADMLADCLDSLARHGGGPSLEVWVVDNASSDHSVAMLRERYPWARLVASTENLGFARGNNLAIRQARGRFIFLLNPDTVVTAGALGKLMDYLETHPEAGMVGPRLCGRDGRLQPASARRAYSLASALCLSVLRLDRLPAIGAWIERRLAHPYDYETTQSVEAISGAAMLARGEVLRELGGFGEVFWHCGEDEDLCARVRAAGWQIGYRCDAVVEHRHGASRRKAPVRTAVNAALSIQQYFLRRQGRAAALCYRAVVQAVEVPILAAVGLFKLALGREQAAQFRERLIICRRLLAWRPME